MENNKKESIIQETNVFTEMLKHFEEATGQFLQKLTQDDKYIKALSRFRDSMLDMKTYFDKVITQSLKNLHLPTKEEIERALYKVTLLEAKMNEISDKLDRVLKSIEK
jgi:hypothetical protein